MEDIYKLMGMHKVSTTGYHPQTDGLVERFNRTLTDMLAKTVDKSGRDWDRHLPHVLFGYRVSPQESTRESPFFLLYGRDAQLPTEATRLPVYHGNEATGLPIHLCNTAFPTTSLASLG